MFKIRQATVADLEGMQHANLTNLPENYTLKYYLYHGLSWPQSSFVATVTSADGVDHIVGYVLARLHDDNDGTSSNDATQGHVTSLSVMRSYRRMGIAAKLMRLSLRSMYDSYGSKSVSLHVRESNRAALHLYRDTLKFEVVKVEKGYYADGEDAYEMKKDLEAMYKEDGADPVDKLQVLMQAVAV